MSRREPTPAIVMAIAMLGPLLTLPGHLVAQTVQGRPVSSGTSLGLAAIDAAARDGKYLFLFFWKENDQNTQSMYQVFQSAMSKWSDAAYSAGIRLADANEKPVVDKFGVSRAPMPLVLALAPNGAVTKGLPIKFDESQLRQAFVSSCTAKCLKAIQDRKLVLLCVQSRRTRFNDLAWKGVRDFKADARFASATEIVALDPDDRTEATFLKDLQVDPRTPQAVTVLLAPPGQPIAKFVGAVGKDQIVGKVASAQSGPCADGKCGPGGCGPKRQEVHR